MLRLFILFFIATIAVSAHAQPGDLEGRAELLTSKDWGTLKDSLKISGRAADHLFDQMTGVPETRYGEIGEGLMKMGKKVTCLRDFIIQTVCFVKISDYATGDL